MIKLILKSASQFLSISKLLFYENSGLQSVVILLHKLQVNKRSSNDI